MADEMEKGSRTGERDPWHWRRVTYFRRFVQRSPRSAGFGKIQMLILSQVLYSSLMDAIPSLVIQKRILYKD